jgi:uncharacterized protein (TIGR00251 family)
VTAVRVTSTSGRVRFAVRVQPRASTTEVAGVHGEALKVRLTAPPVDGAANEALIHFLADVFVVKRQAVRIVGGESSRSKIVEIDGITERAVHDVASGATRRC